MSEDEKPDTTDAVARAIAKQFNVHAMRGNNTDTEIASVAIAAHDEELKRLGYVTVKIGASVPWMIGSVIEHAHELCDDTCTREDLNRDLR